MTPALRSIHFLHRHCSAVERLAGSHAALSRAVGCNSRPQSSATHRSSRSEPRRRRCSGGEWSRIRCAHGVIRRRVSPSLAAVLLSGRLVVLHCVTSASVARARVHCHSATPHVRPSGFSRIGIGTGLTPCHICIGTACVRPAARATGSCAVVLNLARCAMHVIFMLYCWYMYVPPSELQGLHSKGSGAMPLTRPAGHSVLRVPVVRNVPKGANRTASG